MEDLSKVLLKMSVNTGEIKKQESGFKQELKELKEAMGQSAMKIQQLQTLLASDDDQDKKKRGKKK